MKKLIPVNSVASSSSSSSSSEMATIQKVDIKTIIKNNGIFVSEINQLLHNEGIIMDDRLDIIIDILNHCLYDNPITITISEKIITEIVTLIKSVSIDKEEIAQVLFMFYCNKKVKIDLDQFYTPFTIGKFLCKLMIPGKSVIDPACGTGDLVKSYDGEITLWDINKDVLDICEQNYTMNDKDFNISCRNSLLENELDNNKHDYVCLNPPFGNSTVTKDKKILDKYVLGRGKKSQELGILFIERSMNLLKENGVAFIIVPNGYLGNSTKSIVELKEYIQQFRIVSIIELPSNTFARSGTGVSTSIITIQKQKPESPYNIFIKNIENIGYVLNKKNTPYKYKTENGEIITHNNMPILDNDLEDCHLEIASFVGNEGIEELNSTDEERQYETVLSSEITSNILDINRYLNRYTSIIKRCKEQNYKEISEYVVKNPKSKFEIVKENEYLYLDIKQITTPIYSKTNYLYGHDLPSRAKINVKKHDIIVSKLKGKLTFTLILSDDTNILCSNGFALLRPKDTRSMVILFANLFCGDLKIQHSSLCTGSIMASLSDDDIKRMLINPNVDIEKYENIIKALEVINTI